MIGSVTHIFISHDEAPWWVKLLFLFPSVAAAVVIVIVVLRERRDRRRWRETKREEGGPAELTR